MNQNRLEVRVGEPDVPHVCGGGDCNHTAIQHREHRGWLGEGQVMCTSPCSEDTLLECSLDWESEVTCQLVQLLDGHVHSDNCGHEKILHGDHVDYLVDGRLHHVVDTQVCCERECLGFVSGPSVVDHGVVSVLKQRFPNSAERVEQQETNEWTDEIVTSIYAAGICCPSEIPVIHKILSPIPGVKSVTVSAMTKTVKVTHIPSKVAPGVMVTALNEAGLQASLGERGQTPDDGHKRPPWTVVFSGVLLIISLMSFFHEDLYNAKYIGIGAAVLGVPFIVIRAFAALRRFVLDINVLTVVAIVGAVALGEYHEAAAIVFLFGLAEWLEDRCMGKARTAVRMLSEMQPEFAIDAASGKPIPVEEVEIDSVVLIRPGDRVPVDGTIIAGESSVDESMLTGESRAVPKGVGSKMRSGTVNSGKGSLSMKATANFQSSTIAQVAELVEKASMQKSNTEKFIEQFSKVYTPVVIIFAVMLTLIPVSMQADNPERWVYLSLVLLVTACPCALVISTPVVTVCGISRAAKQSILIKGGQYLEALARVKAITFDKTGTLTEGRFGVTSIYCVEGVSEREVMQLAAALEVHSNHPLGAAIAGSASARGYVDWGEVADMQVVAGKGIVGKVLGKEVGCGNAALMTSLAPDTPIPHIDVHDGGSVCYVACQSRVIGAISVSDTTRAEATRAINKLKSLGVTAAMLTGDQTHTAQSVANMVGIDESHVHAELLPQDKLDMVATYKNKFGKIAHIGDGINDAPALAQADIGIAMGIGGSALAVEAADIALFSNDLSNLPVAIKISKQVRAKLIQNITFAITVKVVVIALAIFNRVDLWQAVLADVGSSMVVVLNGLTILGFRKSKGGESKSCVAKALEVIEGDICCSSRKICASRKVSRKCISDNPCCGDGVGRCGSQSSRLSKHDHSDHSDHLPNQFHMSVQQTGDGCCGHSHPHVSIALGQESEHCSSSGARKTCWVENATIIDISNGGGAGGVKKGGCCGGAAREAQKRKSCSGDGEKKGCGSTEAAPLRKKTSCSGDNPLEVKKSNCCGGGSTSTSKKETGCCPGAASEVKKSSCCGGGAPVVKKTGCCGGDTPPEVKKSDCCGGGGSSTAKKETGCCSGATPGVKKSKCSGGSSESDKID